MLKEDFEKQRKIIHDISNKLSIADGNLSYFLKASDSTLEQVEKSQQYLKDSIKALKELRALVGELEKKED